MADASLVQKDEIGILRAAWPLLERKRDAAIGLLLDCLRPCPDATLSNVTHTTEVVMNKWIAVLVAVVGLASASPSFAQESHPGAGGVIVTVIPASGTFFTQGKDTKAPSFGNYGAGASAEVRVSRYVGIEGEVTGAFGITQNLDFTSGTVNEKTPNLLNYSGNVVVSVPTRHSIEPYVTGGVGGLTLYDKPALGIADTDTFFTSNVGGGVKWFNGRWGVRADYRFIAVKSKADAPSFFGQDTRYGHRVYGGLLINVR